MVVTRQAKELRAEALAHVLSNVLELDNDSDIHQLITSKRINDVGTVLSLADNVDALLYPVVTSTSDAGVDNI